jgi:hypothetical protein
MIYLTKFYTVVTLSCMAAGVGHSHDHFEAGILDANENSQPDAGEKLRVIGPDFTHRVFRLLPRPFGFRPVQRCGGFYMLDDSVRTVFPLDAFTFSALSDGQEQAGDIDHAATGAYIWMEILSVTGPPGAKFGFWETGRSAAFDTPSVSFTTNAPTGNHAFVISGGYDAADQDPHGHFHGRAWTADRPGDYRVTYRLVDLSTSGPGGGPWHLPSDPFTFHFQAGPDFTPKGTLMPGTGFILTWASQMGIRDPFQPGVEFKVMRSTDPASGVWSEIGAVTGTTAATATFTDGAPPPQKAFYRLAYTWAPEGPAEN